MNPYTAGAGKNTLCFPATTSVCGNTCSYLYDHESPRSTLSVREAGMYVFFILGAGGSGGAYMNTAIRYSPGAGGGGGATEVAVIELLPGDEISFDTPPPVTTPSSSAGVTGVYITRNNTSLATFEVNSGQPGETWDGVSPTAPIGGWGGVSSHPTNSGTKGNNSYLNSVSAPIAVSTDQSGGVSIYTNLGRGGDGAQTSPYPSSSYGGGGAVIVMKSST